jgi:GAF domain
MANSRYRDQLESRYGDLGADRQPRMPVRPGVFGIVVTEGRPHISNDVQNDPVRVGEPPGHPDVRTFLGVSLQLGTEVIGMIGEMNLWRWSASAWRLPSGWMSGAPAAEPPG